MPISIAIDGPAGAGKSTIARNLANTLTDFVYISTGELYRSLGYACLKYNLDPTNKALVEFLPFIMEFDYSIIKENCGNRLRVMLGAEDITAKLHTKAVSDITPIVASYPNIREHFRQIQRDLASKYNVVMEGRDIGTVVLPNADYKFFADASVEVRADRRYAELIEKGAQADYEEILDSIKKRDYADRHRPHSPLICPEDAHFVDTSHKSVAEVVAEMQEIIHKQAQKPCIDKSIVL